MYPIKPSLMWKLPPLQVAVLLCLFSVLWNKRLCSFHTTSVFSSSGHLFLKAVLSWCPAVISFPACVLEKVGPPVAIPKVQFCFPSRCVHRHHVDC